LRGGARLCVAGRKAGTWQSSRCGGNTDELGDVSGSPG